MNADVGGQNSELITQYLLHFGASIWEKDYRGHLAVQCAAIRGNTNIVDVLIKVNTSQTNKILKSYGTKSQLKGMNLVHVAVWKTNIELLDLLLKHGCSTNHRDVYGRTPFYCAVAESDDTNFELIRRLIPISDVKQADKDGFTPLHVAILKGKTNTAKLICSISDVNAQDKYGKTPLHTACEQQNSEIFRTLVEDHKADLRILTKTGKSVLNILLTTLVRPILSNFISQKKLKKMNPEGIKAGILYVEEIPVWEDIVDAIRNKDPEFVKLWIDIYTRQISSKI
jgi:ankyrin repeat protein